MAWTRHDEECSACRPTVINTTTGEMLPDTDPRMQAVMTVWDSMPLAGKEAFHRFTCLNSREPFDVLVVRGMQSAIRKEMEK